MQYLCKIIVSIKIFMMSYTLPNVIRVSYTHDFFIVSQSDLYGKNWYRKYVFSLFNYVFLDQRLLIINTLLTGSIHFTITLTLLPTPY